MSMRWERGLRTRASRVGEFSWEWKKPMVVQVTETELSRLKDNLEKAAVENFRVRRKWERLRDEPRGIPASGVEESSLDWEESMVEQVSKREEGEERQP